VRVLIVEDEPYLAEAIRDGLRLEAIAADIAGDGDTALELLGINAAGVRTRGATPGCRSGTCSPQVLDHPLDEPAEGLSRRRPGQQLDQPAGRGVVDVPVGEPLPAGRLGLQRFSSRRSC
jgi:CheY-like chemotaxis protein